MEKRVLHSQRNPFEGYKSHRNVLLKCHGDPSPLNNEAQGLEASVESKGGCVGRGQLGPFISSGARREHRAKLAHPRKPPAGRGPYLEAEVCAELMRRRGRHALRGRRRSNRYKEPVVGRQPPGKEEVSTGGEETAERTRVWPGGRWQEPGRVGHQAWWREGSALDAGEPAGLRAKGRYDLIFLFRRAAV